MTFQMRRSGLIHGATLVLFGLALDACTCRSVGSNQQLIGVPLPEDGGPSAQGVVQIAPQALDFGNVLIHTQASLPITLTNSSSGPTTLTFSAMQGADASLFTFSKLPSMTLAPGQVETLTVTFAPIQLSATASTASFGISECQGCTGVAITLTGQSVATGLSITPDPLDFGFLPVGSAAVTKTIQLSNVANQPIQLLKTPVLGAGSPAQAFALGASAPKFPFTLAPGQSQTVPVTFTAPRPAAYTNTLTFYSNDPQAGQVAVPLTGVGGGPQIQCLPTSLAFAQVAVGSPVTQQVLCTNAGQAVPGDPAATLQISALTVPDDPSFTAHFDQPPPVGGLTSGQSVLIDVVYAPPAAQTDSGHLHIANNDTQLPDEVVPLTGTALSLAPCDSLIAPAGGLVFGEVQEGQSLELQLSIVNQGATDCLVDGLNLSAATPSAFTLPSGPVVSQILGFAGNPQGTPSSLTVPVKFAPQQAGMFSGAVDFTISNPSKPQITVPVTGESGPSCLVINPSSVDFGTVNLNTTTNAWCSSLSRNIELINTCTTDLHATAITIATGTGSPQFVISGQPASYPALIPAGGVPLTFQVTFQPDSAGAMYGMASVTLQESPQGPYLVPLQGNAQATGQETDNFAVGTAPPEVDLLFVMDNDDDTTQYPDLVKNALPAFWAAMPADIDLHMALTDDDYCTAAGADHGSFEPCPNCQYTTNPADGTTTTVFTSQNANAEAEIAGLIPHPSWNCASAGGDEHMFDGFYLALQPNILTGVNAGFLRPNAYLAILEIDDDAEDDLSPTLGSVQAYYDFLVGVKGDAALVSYSYVNQGLSSIPGGQNARVSQLVQMTGGVESDMSTNTWITDLVGLWTAATGLGQSIFPLNGQPVATSVVVTVDGVAVPAANWTYNAVSNAIDFVPATAPTAGQTVSVTYTVACN
jgi:hypothetical protein